MQKVLHQVQPMHFLDLTTAYSSIQDSDLSLRISEVLHPDCEQFSLSSLYRPGSEWWMEKMPELPSGTGKKEAERPKPQSNSQLQVVAQSAGPGSGSSAEYNSFQAKTPSYSNTEPSSGSASPVLGGVPRL